MKLEKIVWMDSASHDGWHNPNLQEYRAIRCTTFGAVIAETDESISVAGTIESPDQVAQVMTIPKAVIVSRKKVGKQV